MHAFGILNSSASCAITRLAAAAILYTLVPCSFVRRSRACYAPHQNIRALLQQRQGMSLGRQHEVGKPERGVFGEEEPSVPKDAEAK